MKRMIHQDRKVVCSNVNWPGQWLHIRLMESWCKLKVMMIFMMMMTATWNIDVDDDDNDYDGDILYWIYYYYTFVYSFTVTSYLYIYPIPGLLSAPNLAVSFLNLVLSLFPTNVFFTLVSFYCSSITLI